MNILISKSKIFSVLFGVIAAIIATNLLWNTPSLLIISLCVIAIVKYYLAPVRHELVMFVITGILGSFTESLMMYSEAWSYAKSDIFNFPIWLPFLWGLAGTIFATIYDALPKRTKSQI